MVSSSFCSKIHLNVQFLDVTVVLQFHTSSNSEGSAFILECLVLKDFIKEQPQVDNFVYVSKAKV